MLTRFITIATLAACAGPAPQSIEQLAGSDATVAPDECSSDGGTCSCTSMGSGSDMGSGSGSSMGSGGGSSMGSGGGSSMGSGGGSSMGSGSNGLRVDAIPFAACVAACKEITGGSTVYTEHTCAAWCTVVQTAGCAGKMGLLQLCTDLGKNGCKTGAEFCLLLAMAVC